MRSRRCRVEVGRESRPERGDEKNAFLRRERETKKEREREKKWKEGTGQSRKRMDGKQGWMKEEGEGG